MLAMGRSSSVVAALSSLSDAGGLATARPALLPGAPTARQEHCSQMEFMELDEQPEEEPVSTSLEGP
jgi:hypothetical protein